VQFAYHYIFIVYFALDEFFYWVRAQDREQKQLAIVEDNALNFCVAIQSQSITNKNSRRVREFLFSSLQIRLM